jgi:hypothetical protein
MTTETAALISEAIRLANISTIDYFTYRITLFILVFILIHLIIKYSYNYFTIGFDDTDDKVNKKRSGLTVYTDYKTGLQYLKSGNAMFPRFDKNGNQLRKD